MFNRLFGKTNLQIHEPLEKQIEDVKQLNPLISESILKGLDCDQLPNSYGEFGSVTNPIPVNGPLGTIKYLGKLRGKTGKAIFFHRLSSTSSPITDNPIDIYEIVCHDGTQWNELHIDMYHPRRSNLCPPGYTLTPYDKKLKMDIPMAYGVDSFVANFPQELPKEIENLIGRPSAFSRRAKEIIAQNEFKRSIISESDENIASESDFDISEYDSILQEFEIRHLAKSPFMGAKAAYLIYKNLRFEYIEFLDLRIFPKFPELRKYRESILEEINNGVIVCGLMAARLNLDLFDTTEGARNYIFEIEAKKAKSEEAYLRVTNHIERLLINFVKGLEIRGENFEILEKTLLDLTGYTFEYATGIKVMKDYKQTSIAGFGRGFEFRLKNPTEFEIQILSIYEAMLKNYLMIFKEEFKTGSEFRDDIIKNFKIDLRKKVREINQDVNENIPKTTKIDIFDEDVEDDQGSFTNEVNFMIHLVKKSIEAEKDVFKNKKEKLMGYTCSKIFNIQYRRRFSIERSFFLLAHIEFQQVGFINTKDYIKLLAESISKEYGLKPDLAVSFIKNRTAFYHDELDMLEKFQHPHPGKIIWCLYNPNGDDIGHEIDDRFEENIFAGLYLLQTINQVFKNEILAYRNKLN